jgi:uncharacterized radical SAM superfamily protein
VDIETSREVSWKNFGPRIRFYTPSFLPYRSKRPTSEARAFPSISITGRGCSLRCKHCGGQLLKTMIPATSPEDLLEVFQELHRRNAVGCLISGGCDVNGAVPLEPFLKVMGEGRRDLGLKIVVHTGLLNQDTGRKLGEVGVDAALIDVIGSDETIREVCGLKRSVGEYEKSLRILEEENIPTVPHVLVGLHYGILKGESEALKIVARHKPSAIVVIGLTPVRKSAMEHCAPPSPKDIVSVIVEARRLMPRTPIALGCVRPKGALRREIDVLAVKAGVNGIAYPDPTAVALARDLSLEYDFSDLCCSQIYEDLGDSKGN